MKTIAINQYYKYTNALKENGYKIAVTKHRYNLGAFNDYIAYNHKEHLFKVITFTRIRDGLSFFDGYRIKDYTLQTLPKKYFEYIY